MPGLMIRRTELAGAAPRDLRVRDGRIVEIGARLAAGDEATLEAEGGALLPGLHDHHLHLLALAAAEHSVRCGPPEVRDRQALARALTAARPSGGWIRGVGYHESVAGELDRAALDSLALDTPLRVQHRSGALWILNSAAVERLGLSGTERETGQLFRADRRLRERIGSRATPDLESTGRRLASFGVTGVTDATVSNGPAELCALEAAVASGALPQRLLVMGTLGLPAPTRSDVARGALKLMLDEARLPHLESLADEIRSAHGGGRSVAFHCVTRVELVLACGALEIAGALAGDRIEHAAVAPPELVERLKALELTVVTQPGFVLERGDAYLTDVEERDRSWLYRGRGFTDAGVPLGAGTDAPFGHPDPWRAMRAAVERRTADGAHLGENERLSPERALALFTSPPEAPGAAPRALDPGAPADLCLLDRPWAEARESLSSEHVATTIRDGRVIWSRGEGP